MFRLEDSGFRIYGLGLGLSGLGCRQGECLPQLKSLYNCLIIGFLEII